MRSNRFAKFFYALFVLILFSLLDSNVSCIFLFLVLTLAWTRILCCPAKSFHPVEPTFASHQTPATLFSSTSSSPCHFLIDKDYERHDIKPLASPQLDKTHTPGALFETATYIHATSIYITSSSTGLPRERKGGLSCGFVCLFDQAPTGRKLVRLRGISHYDSLLSRATRTHSCMCLRVRYAYGINLV